MPFRLPSLVARAQANADGIGLQLRRVLYALFGIQAVLAVTLIVGAISTSHGVSRLVEDRLYPIGELQQVTDRYAKALATAHKVESGNISPAGAVDEISNARAVIARSWSNFRRHDIDARHGAAVTVTGK